MKKILLILAAGRGTRMRSRQTKILHPLLGMPLIQWSLKLAKEAELEPWLVVGYQEQTIRDALVGTTARFVRQPEARGTGHAVRCALESLPEAGQMVVMCGDTPLFKQETIHQLLSIHGDNWVTVATAKIAEPAAYGRIVRDRNAAICQIVEASEASPEQLQIPEINTGVYVFDIAWLRSVIDDFAPHPPKNEIYLTDAVELAAAHEKAQGFVLDDFQQCMGINNRWDLAQATKVMQQRILKRHAMAGVTIEDPSSVTVEEGVEIGQDCVLERGAVIRGRTSIGEQVRIGAYSVLSDCHLADQVTVFPHCHCEGVIIGTAAKIGPFARLREGTELGDKVKIGNFVETKKSQFSSGAKASHLSYIGDAVVGQNANIGAGTITCNYDGFHKHKTQIGADAFIGSNSSLVAPVVIGEGALVGAGSTIVDDVPAQSIGIGRSKQHNLVGAASRYRQKKKMEK